MKHYIAWFKKIYKQYGFWQAVMCAHYNAKHYDIDGNYKNTKVSAICSKK